MTTPGIRITRLEITHIRITNITLMEASGTAALTAPGETSRGLEHAGLPRRTATGAPSPRRACRPAIALPAAPSPYPATAGGVIALPAPGQGWHQPATVGRPADPGPSDLRPTEPATLASATIAALLGQPGPHPGGEPATTAAVLRAGPPEASVSSEAPVLPAPPVCWTLERSAA